MPSVSTATASQRATYTALSGLFVAIFTVLSTRKSAKGATELGPLDLLKLGFATYRLGRMVAYDKVFETYRSPFTETVPDGSGAGMTVEPKGEGMQRALGELLSCPVCAGTWIAAGLVFGLQFAPTPAKIFINIMGTVGLAEALDAATEALTWTGQNARECAGNARMGKENMGARGY